MLSRLSQCAVRSVARAAALQLSRPAPALLSRSFRHFAPLLANRGQGAQAQRVEHEERDLARAEEDADEDEEFDYDPEQFDEYGREVEADEEVASVGKPAPFWHATALVDGKFEQLNATQFLGHWTTLIFYPLDFTFVCPTEIRAFNDRVAEFEKLGVKLLLCSVDSEYSHLAWTQQPKEAGGLGPMKIPMLADITKSIAKNFGVLIEDKGVALRGLFIIDPNGIVRQSTINDLPIGRSVDETLRLLQAFQFHEQNGEVCPANWKPGQKAMKADADGLKDYFGKK